MNRLNHFLEISLASGMLGVISEYLAGVHVSCMILTLLIIIDTTAGILNARKYHRFSSRGLKLLVKKVMSYGVAILTVRLLEINIFSSLNTSVLSNTLASFLAITESVSILENLALLGAPLPPNILSFLLENLKIAQIGNTFTGAAKKNKSYMSEIEDIIAYHIPTFEKTCLRGLLEVKFEVWKNVAIQLDIALNDVTEMDNEHLYFQVLSLIELALRDMNVRWEEEQIPKDCIQRFTKGHQPKVDNWLKKVNTICHSKDGVQEKKNQLIESIIVLLYQTIVDAHKSKY